MEFGLLFFSSALMSVLVFLALEAVVRAVSARREKRELEAEDRIRLQLHLPPYRWHPLMGQVHVANYCSPTCVTDEHGFRSRISIPPHKPAGECRVLLAGGSTAAGAGAADGLTIRDGLQDQFDRARRSTFVLNVAQSAFNSSQELVQVALILLDLEPDVLILIDGRNDFFFATRNDWRPHITYRMSRFAGLYDDAHQRAKRRASFVATLVGDLRTILSASQVFSAAYRATRLLRPTRTPPPARVEVAQIRTAARIYCENVRKIAVLAKNYGCRLYTLGAPSLLDTKKRLSERESAVSGALRSGALFYEEGAIRHYASFARWAEERLVSLASEEGFVYRNCRDVFDHVGSDVEVFLDDCHLTPAGQAILSKAIYRTVEGPLARDFWGASG